MKKNLMFAAILLCLSSTLGLVAASMVYIYEGGNAPWRRICLQEKEGQPGAYRIIKDGKCQACKDGKEAGISAKLYWPPRNALSEAEMETGIAIGGGVQRGFQIFPWRSWYTPLKAGLSPQCEPVSDEFGQAGQWQWFRFCLERVPGKDSEFVVKHSAPCLQCKDGLEDGINAKINWPFGYAPKVGTPVPLEGIWWGGDQYRWRYWYDPGFGHLSPQCELVDEAAKK